MVIPRGLKPARLLVDHISLFEDISPNGPALDLACGDGHNGIFLALQGLEVILCDKSQRALERSRELAEQNHISVERWQVDLEQEGVSPLPPDFFAAIIVFRYLHRALIPDIKLALKKKGVLIYETFTTAQAKLGKPKNPDFLLKTGELLSWFQDWEVLHHFEGTLENPARAVSQIVCRKP
ncbi:methyltransferase domain-containing protein [Thermodesulfobacteriota bacterium]